MLRQGYDQFRVDMQEHAKGMSDVDLDEALKDMEYHRRWPRGLDKLRKEMENAGLDGLIIEAFQGEKFLREYSNREK